MRAVINDNSFEYKFPSKEVAISAFHQWLEICKKLNHKSVRRVQEVYGNYIDTSMDIAPDYKIIQLVQEFRDREDRSRLLGFLVNSRNYIVDDNILYIEGKTSKAGTFAYKDGILISLYSNAIFENDKVKGSINGNVAEIDNLSTMEHLYIHSAKLGIRYYEHNSKHKKKAYIRSGGVIASEMDLLAEIAQKVLDTAIEMDGHLYGCYNDTYYEFRRTEKNTYHGYKNVKLSKELKKKIALRQDTFGSEAEF